MADNKLKREIEYKLQNPISIHKGGEQVFANSILLKAPTMAQMRDRCVLKQAIMDSMQKMQERTASKNQDTSNTDESEVNFGDQMTSVLYMNKNDEEIEKILKSFMNILLVSAEIDSVKMTDVLVNKIDADELDSMLGEYIANFILPSWMKRMMNT